MEKREISAGAKQRVAELILRVETAVVMRDEYIKGLMGGLGLDGEWRFSFDDYTFTKVEEKKPCPDTEKLPLTEALLTSKT